MTNEEKIKAIEAWQSSEVVHPLTCGNDSKHSLLRAEEDDHGSVILKCDDCDYVQEAIPPQVFKAHHSGEIEIQKLQIENASLEAELKYIRDYATKEHPMFSSVGCPLCAYESGKLIEACAFHKVLADLAGDCERFKREIDNLNSSNIHLAKMSLAEKDEEKENLALAARLVMRNAFDKDGDFFHGYVANIAMLLYDKGWITKRRLRNDVAIAVLRLIFWDER